MNGLFKYIRNCASFARALSYSGHLETSRFEARAEEKNSMSCVITVSAPTNDHAHFMGLQTAGLCGAQLLNNGIFTACKFFI